MRRYETILVLRSDLPETQIKDTLKRFEGVLTANGAHVLGTEDWGVRELAYRIRREHRAQYFRLDYLASAAAVNELERNLKLSDAVLRYLSVLTETRPDLSKLNQQTKASGQTQAEASGKEIEPSAPTAEVRPEAAEGASDKGEAEKPTTTQDEAEQN